MVELTTFWSTFGGIVLIIIGGAIYTRVQLARHDTLLDMHKTTFNTFRQQVDKDNVGQDNEVKNVETRLSTEVQRLREENKDRQNELKQDIASFREEIRQDFEKLYKMIDRK